MAVDHAQVMADLNAGQKKNHRLSESDGSDTDCSCNRNIVVSKKRKVFPALATQLALQEDSAAAAVGYLPPSPASCSAPLSTPVLAISAVQPRLSDRSHGGMLSASEPQKKKAEGAPPVFHSWLTNSF